MMYRFGYPKVLEPVLRFGNTSQIPVTSPGGTFEQHSPMCARQPRRGGKPSAPRALEVWVIVLAPTLDFARCSG